MYTVKQGNHNINMVFPKVNGRFTLGEFSFVSKEAEIKCYKFPKNVKIGKYSSIGKCSFLIDANHNPYFASTFPFAELCVSHRAPHNELKKSTPKVGNDVWIGDNAYIHSGVLIGDGSVITGNAVVTKNVPPYAIFGGNPGRVLKYRFDEDIVNRYIKVQWWDLPDSFVANKLAPHLADPIKFLEIAEEFKFHNATHLSL